MLAFIITSCGFLLFSTTFLFINNSVTFDKLGAINGLAMTLASITRLVFWLALGVYHRTAYLGNFNIHKHYA